MKAERGCGPCSQCCKVLAIAELAKPGGVRCTHMRAGGGCAIHGQHPQSCRAFSCLWIDLPELPHRFRPDISKVVLGQDGAGKRLIAHCDPANPLAWRREPMFGFLKAQARAHWNGGIEVLAKAGQRVWLIGPGDEMDLGEIDPLSPLTLWRFPDGTARHLVHPPLAADQALADIGVLPLEP